MSPKTSDSQLMFQLIPKAEPRRRLRRAPGIWVCGAEIERMVAAGTDYSASNATRRLRELHEEKPERVEREYPKGKHVETLAYYRYVPSPYELLM